MTCSRGNPWSTPRSSSRAGMSGTTALVAIGVHAASRPTPTGPFTAAHVGAFIALVLAGASLSTRTEGGDTPLIQASEQAFPFETIKLMCELGADLEQPVTEADGLNLKAPHVACALGLEDRFICLMLDKGVPADSRSPKPGFFTPLMAAAAAGRTSLLKLLLSRGADLHARNGFEIPIHSFAVEHPATLQYLLNLPAQIHGGTPLNPNDADMWGATALHGCVFAEQNRAVSARILLRAGARQLSATEYWEDPIKKTGFHRGTPAEMAGEMGKSDLVQLFESWNYS